MRVYLWAVRLVFAHVVDFVHGNILHHRPFWTCDLVFRIWPQGNHDCWFCRWAWKKDYVN